MPSRPGSRRRLALSLVLRIRLDLLLGLRDGDAVVEACISGDDHLGAGRQTVADQYLAIGLYRDMHALAVGLAVTGCKDVSALGIFQQGTPRYDDATLIG